jgi:3-oxoadipate enol-lactonase
VVTGLLLIHPWPTDARSWDAQVEALPRDHLAVVAPSLPGFGGSEPAGEVMTMRDGAERCLAELDGAGVERAVVCGLSMGGYVAFELWRRARERIAGLVLANTRAVADTREAAANRRTLAERLRAEGIGFFLDDLPPLLSDRAPDDVRDRLRAIVSEQPPTAIAAALLGMAERVDSTADLDGIDVPTMVITSDLDALVPPEVSRDMASGIRGSRLEVFDGAGHLTNMESPGAFTAALERHLAACGLG